MARGWQRELGYLKEVEPKKDLWDRVLAKSPHEPVVSARTRIVSAAVALGLGGATALLVWTAFGHGIGRHGGSSPGTAPSAISNGNIAVVATRNHNSEVALYTPEGNLVAEHSLGSQEIQNPMWSSDGTRLLISGEQAIYEMNADGSNLHQLVSARWLGPSLSPDGKTLAATAVTSQGLFIYLIDIATGDTRPLLPGSPSISASPVQTALGARDTLDSSPDWSPNGTKIVFSRNDGIYVANTDGTGLQQIASSGGLPRWSPDGTKIVFDKGSNQTSIWVMNADGSNSKQLADLGGFALDPSWSPDGTKIVFDNDPVDPGTNGQGVQHTIPDVYVMNADGSGLHKIISGESTNNYYCCEQPAWQPVPGARGTESAGS